MEENKIENKEKKKFNKKYLAFGVVGILALMVVSAAVLNYYGQVKTTIDVTQPISFFVENIEYTGTQATEKINCNAGEICIGPNTYKVVNDGNSARTVSLITTGDTNEIDVSYLKGLYAYSRTWTANGDVLVTVEDTKDGWLQWTYNASTPTTSGKLKMTVEINNPTGFGITTFDDGSHDGWYYYNASGIVRISNYDGTEKISGYEFIETSSVTDGLRVRIKKTALPNTFMWQGFANFHLASNWIELNTTVSPWIPTGSGTLGETLTNPIAIPAGSFIEFYPQFSVDSMATDGDYIIYTTVNA
jgi:hypothetical protein